MPPVNSPSVRSLLSIRLYRVQDERERERSGIYFSIVCNGLTGLNSSKIPPRSLPLRRLYNI